MMLRSGYELKKPCAFKNQSLTQHLKEVVEIAEKHLTLGYIKTVTQKFKMNNIDVEDKSLEEILPLTALFHDIGKAIEYYQQQFDEKCNNIYPKYSFYLHELFSAIYLRRYFSVVRKYSEDLQYLSLLSVINHMHALRDYPELRDLLHPTQKVATKIKNIFEKAFIKSNYIDDLKNDFASYTFLDIDSFCKALNSKISLNECRALLDKIRDFENSKSFSKLYVLILLPLVVSDNIAAYKSRKDDDEYRSKSLFIEELKQMVDEVSYVNE